MNLYFASMTMALKNWILNTSYLVTKRQASLFHLIHLTSWLFFPHSQWISLHPLPLFSPQFLICFKVFRSLRKKFILQYHFLRWLLRKRSLRYLLVVSLTGLAHDKAFFLSSFYTIWCKEKNVFCILNNVLLFYLTCLNKQILISSEL